MRILLAIDGSRSSQAAVDEVARLPWPPHSEVRIVTVDAPIDPGLISRGSASAFDEIVAQQRAEAAQRLLGAAAAITTNSPSLSVSTALLEGNPKDEIINEAERWGADIVVVGSHGYGPVRRFFLGSVSQFVTHNAPCSVLIVRARPENPSPGDAATEKTGVPS